MTLRINNRSPIEHKTQLTSFPGHRNEKEKEETACRFHIPNEQGVCPLAVLTLLSRTERSS